MECWSNGKKVVACYALCVDFLTRNSKHATRNRHLSLNLLDLNSNTPILQYSSTNLLLLLVITKLIGQADCCLILSSAFSPMRLTKTPTISRRYQATPRILSRTRDSLPAILPASTRTSSSMTLPTKNSSAI